MMTIYEINHALGQLIKELAITMSTAEANKYVFLQNMRHRLQNVHDEIGNVMGRHALDTATEDDKVRPSVLDQLFKDIHELNERVNKLAIENNARRIECEAVTEQYIDMSVKVTKLDGRFQETEQFGNRLFKLEHDVTRMWDSIAATEKAFADFSDDVNQRFTDFGNTVSAINDGLEELEMFRDHNGMTQHILNEIAVLNRRLQNLKTKVSSLDRNLPDDTETRLHDLETVVNKLRVYHNKKCEHGARIKYYIETPERA